MPTISSIISSRIISKHKTDSVNGYSQALTYQIILTMTSMNKCSQILSIIISDGNWRGIYRHTTRYSRITILPLLIRVSFTCLHSIFGQTICLIVVQQAMLTPVTSLRPQNSPQQHPNLTVAQNLTLKALVSILEASQVTRMSEVSIKNINKILIFSSIIEEF